MVIFQVEGLVHHCSLHAITGVSLKHGSVMMILTVRMVKMKRIVVSFVFIDRVYMNWFLWKYTGLTRKVKVVFQAQLFSKSQFGDLKS